MVRSFWGWGGKGKCFLASRDSSLEESISCLLRQRGIDLKAPSSSPVFGPKPLCRVDKLSRYDYVAAHFE